MELRECVQSWLSYIPQTFPHYTRHTEKHSDEIVVQASKLLFNDEDPNRATIKMSSLEAYILIASAYLHDVGMVVADQEKMEILKSETWKEWVSTGAGAQRWQDIYMLRNGNQPQNEVDRNFIADLQVRFLVAEFIRRVHHYRVDDVIRRHHTALARFSFDDPVLQRTITDVCIAHGLPHHELEDQERYPDRRDIRGEAVNVRLMAILLRLADLLDMSSDRACPLLLNAACPLPPDSLAHWSQYQRITHRLTAPDKLEITAECETQDEHRVLQDWCQWIVDEIKNARALMARASRHGEWHPPHASLEGSESTIVIRPAPGATYIPSSWSFELDQESVFERLIHDVYQHPLIFIRELIQNSLDAIRCRMYSDLRRKSIDPPEFPTHVSKDQREQYSLNIVLENRNIFNALSGHNEQKQVLIIEDSGIGMDREIIQKYLLQVGRSYYTTDEFRRNYGFVPMSRFGIGFLSVFAASNLVTIDTYKPLSSQVDGPVRLTLTGPRNYLLTEIGQRSTCGTKIEVYLKDPIEAGAVTRMISSWCRRVEFPIYVTEFGAETLIVAEQPGMFVYEIPCVTRKSARFLIRSYPIDRPGVEGEFYIFAYIDEKGESWAERDWATYRYPKINPRATQPPTVENLVCLHGIASESHPYLSDGSVSVRVDYRGSAVRADLSRHQIAHSRNYARDTDPVLMSRLEEILKEHLNTTPRARGRDGWKYKQKLIDSIAAPKFWSYLPHTIQVYGRGKPKLVSLEELAKESVITTILDFSVCCTLGSLQNFSFLFDLDKKRKKQLGKISVTHPRVPGTVLIERDINQLSYTHRRAIFESKRVELVNWSPKNHRLAIQWKTDRTSSSLFDKKSHRLILARMPPEVIGAKIHKTVDNIYECVLLNRKNSLVQWLLEVCRACQSEVFGLKTEQMNILIDLIETVVRYEGHKLDDLTKYLDQWRCELTGLPKKLSPPLLNKTRAKIFITASRHF